ncbi:MAG TPA: outer membrane lipoprotein-sorting protein, partial [Oceanospirillales bacterium]|nr:outer membrane lipoprotein-sorting protein [Oceanospirillales bacterium]
MSGVSAQAEFSLEGLSAEQQGLAIAKERKARDLGWGDSTSSVIMTLRNAQGEESIREMRMKSLEVANDGDKGLTIFDTPKDVKGTAFLNFSHIEKSDDQWLYLPALKRVKRISSRNKSGPFMGSEFAYEDLSSFEIEKY